MAVCHFIWAVSNNSPPACAHTHTHTSLPRTVLNKTLVQHFIESARGEPFEWHYRRCRQVRTGSVRLISLTYVPKSAWSGEPHRLHYTGQKSTSLWCFICEICHHWQNSSPSSSITIVCLQIAKHKELSKPENTLSVSVSAISFIIPSLFILWSRTEWLKSQSARRQMKCFPLPSKREEPNSKKWGYFVYLAYSTIKICAVTEAKEIFEMIHRTNVGVFPSIRAWFCILNHHFYPNYSFFLPILYSALNRRVQIRAASPQRCTCVTARAVRALPQVCAFCLHLYYGSCSSATSNCVCWSVIPRYWTHSSVYTP